MTEEEKEALLAKEWAEMVEAGRVDTQLLAFACARISAEDLPKKVQECLLDFLGYREDGTACIDFTQIKSPEAEALFKALADESHESGFAFGFVFADRLGDYDSKIVPINAEALRLVSRHLIEHIPASAYPEDLRDIKISADLGL